MSLRVLNINDISCFGKCSFTVTLPILASLGIETAIVPTGIYSSHTGFKDFVFTDLSDSMIRTFKQYQENNIEFSAFYSGYLGSNKTLEDVLDFLKGNTFSIKLIDPVMADSGVLYCKFDLSYVHDMVKLCQQADIITPNYTEACLLADLAYKETIIGIEEVESLAKAIYLKTAVKTIIITGLNMKENEIACAIYSNERLSIVCKPKFEGAFHGTGDIFASLVIGLLLKNYSLLDSVNLAMNFINEAIKVTIDEHSDVKNGLLFESSLKKLTNLI